MKVELLTHFYLQDVSQQHCTSIVGYVSDSQTDLQTPVQFALSYALVQDEPSVSYDRGLPLPPVVTPAAGVATLEGAGERLTAGLVLHLEVVQAHQVLLTPKLTNYLDLKQ